MIKNLKTIISTIRKWVSDNIVYDSKAEWIISAVGFLIALLGVLSGSGFLIGIAIVPLVVNVIKIHNEMFH